MNILYTLDCPRCDILKDRLDEKNIKYEICKDINAIRAKGYMTAPLLEIDGKIMDFSAAIQWLNSK